MTAHTSLLGLVRAAVPLLALFAPVFVSAEDKFQCSATKPCEIGCCGGDDAVNGEGYCGMGPKFCGDSCISSCHYKSECDPGWGIEWSNATSCPLNVCCSEYGFCGVTPSFCGDNKVPQPSCPGGKSADVRTIGYYEGWNLHVRPCGHMTPEEIPLGWYTHINFAFALINPDTFHIEGMDSQTELLYDRVTALKRRQPGLEVWIAIGGWAMNDPGPHRTTFSDLAASESAQDAFFESLITFMQKHDFDGVDLDWEYPVADDRGGRPEDYENYVNLLRRLRDRLNKTGRHYGVTLTLPASYWYLRGFDLQGIEPYLDWLNIMTYDIHGVWDSTVKAMGPYAFAHTNLTEIEMAMDLLWRNQINPGRIVLGLGFYGRSFTMKDPNCLAAGCEFTEGAVGGACTGTPGVLSAAEIVEIIDSGRATITHDPVAAVKIVTWDNNQWVSWDDAETLKAKLDYANMRCLGGTMVWAIDLDDGTLLSALAENLSREKANVFNGTGEWEVACSGEKYKIDPDNGDLVYYTHDEL